MSSVNVQTDHGLRTIARTPSHIWHADEPLDGGGTDTAPTPMEMMLGALGSCVVITVQLYAQRKNWPLERVEMDLHIQRFMKADYPAYQGAAAMIHEIREQVTLHGPLLTDDQRARLHDIAGKCPVRRVLENPVFFVAGHEQPARKE